MNSAIQNQDVMLKESIKQFLELHQNGCSDFSFFETIFFRLIQTMLDPPVEITWFYSAVTFHAAKSSSQKGLSARVLIVKDLLNLHISCSNLSSTSKKIVLLAPVVYELYDILYDFGKTESSVKFEVNKLLDNITNHIMLFPGIHDYGKGVVEFENMAVCFEDLVRVWTADRGGGSRIMGENLTSFFPVFSDCIWRWPNSRHGMQELVGIVLCEVFLLKLCLNFGSSQSKEEFLKDTKNHAVHIIKAFHNCYFVVFLSQANHRLIFALVSFTPLSKMSAPVMNLVDGQNLNIGHDVVINCSINYFMNEYPKNGSDFSSLLLLYQKLVQDLEDPPLEILWFYVAISFHCSSLKNLKPQKRLLLVQNLLHSLKTSSRRCGVVKKIDLIAPIPYFLYSLELNFSVRNPLLLEEIGSVVEKLTCYFSICCSQYLYGENEGLNNVGEHFVDLLRVWTIDQTGGACDACVLATFFPILNNRFLKDIIEQPGYLAGAIMNETLLLRMYLRIAQGLNQEVSRRDMLSLAIQTIKGFQYFYFIDILFKTLLEPSLPVKALLCSTDEILLRKVLYNAVVLIDYSFYFGRWNQSPDNHPKKLALLWLLVADKAIRFALSANDFATVISYINAFGESQIVTEIIKWAKLQAGIEDPINRLHIQHPQIIIEWLLILEGYGIKIFDEETLVLAKESMCEPRINFSLNSMDLSSYAVDVNEGQVGNVSTSNKVDVSEGPEIGDPSGNAHSFANAEAESSKKRKEAFLTDVDDPQLKHAKHGDSPGSFPAGDDFTYVTSDDDMAEA